MRELKPNWVSKLVKFSPAAVDCLARNGQTDDAYIQGGVSKGEYKTFAFLVILWAQHTVFLNELPPPPPKKKNKKKNTISVQLYFSVWRPRLIKNGLY